MTTTSGKQLQLQLKKSFSVWSRQEHLFLAAIGLSSILTLLLFIRYLEIPLQITRQLRKSNKGVRADYLVLRTNSMSLIPIAKIYPLPYVRGESYSGQKINSTSSSISAKTINVPTQAMFPLYSQSSSKEEPMKIFTESNKLCFNPRYCSVSQTKSLHSPRQQCFNQTHSFSFTPQMRLVHFDLKGAPPKISYIMKTLPLLKKSGATGILIEYEDMFPYWGDLAQITALNSYSVKDVRKILTVAKLLDLEVIPLIQTFGHLEYVLKLPQFAHLRESNDSASAICPLNRGSFALVTAMIDQVLSLHPEVKWLHIGCDEVFRLALCNKCNKYQYKKDVLFLQHVTRIARYTRKKHKVTPIIWDDMLRRVSSHVLRNSKIGSLVEPMVWVYGESVERYFFPNMWQRYRMVFSNLWTASAFKGAFGRNILIPNFKRHLNNHISWLSAMAKQKSIHFQGIALTGWQRYEHYAPLCELFPVGLPSLILNLLTVSEGCLTFRVFQRFRDLLSCEKSDDYKSDEPFSVIEQDPYFQRTLNDCSFPGSKLFFAIQKVSNFNDTFFTLLRRVCKFQLDEKMTLNDESKSKNLKITMLKTISLQPLIAGCQNALLEVYDNLTTSEWMEQNLNPISKKRDELLTNVQNSSAKNSCQQSNKVSFVRKFPIDFQKSG